MGLKDIRKNAIECLKSGRVQAENRADIKDKNLLKTGVVTTDIVVTLLGATRGNQYRTVPHKDDPTVSIHIFEPTVSGENWHIKLYFLDPDCWFISVHKSHVVRPANNMNRRHHANIQRRR